VIISTAILLATTLHGSDLDEVRKKLHHKLASKVLQRHLPPRGAEATDAHVNQVYALAMFESPVIRRGLLSAALKREYGAKLRAHLVIASGTHVRKGSDLHLGAMIGKLDQMDYSPPISPRRFMPDFPAELHEVFTKDEDEYVRHLAVILMSRYMGSLQARHAILRYLEEPIQRFQGRALLEFPPIKDQEFFNDLLKVLSVRQDQYLTRALLHGNAKNQQRMEKLRAHIKRRSALSWFYDQVFAQGFRDRSGYNSHSSRTRYIDVPKWLIEMATTDLESPDVSLYPKQMIIYRLAMVRPMADNVRNLVESHIHLISEAERSKVMRRLDMETGSIRKQE